MTTPAIAIEALSKRYRVGQWLPSLRDIFDWRKHARPEEFHWALRGVSFELRPGESLGVIGPNGAGKTTLLKILSRVTEPTSGSMRVNGRLSALIELGAGFHPDLTGRENVYLNGAILGMRRSDIRARFDSIVDFAGIGSFLDTPVKRYSSGMYARLGFAIAAHVDPEVLLVDEVLAVGDFAFQAKCHARMDELRKNGTSLVFISHNMDAVRRVCDRGLVMYRGEAIYQGTASDAIVAYSDAIRESAREWKLATPSEEGLSQRVMTFDAEIERVSLLDADGNQVTGVQSGSPAIVAVDVRFHKEVRHPIFSMTVRTPDGRVVYDTTTRWMNIETPNFNLGDSCRVQFAIETPLLDGEYELGVDVAASDFGHYYDRVERAMGFWVRGPGSIQGIVDLSAKVSIARLSPVGEAV